MSLHSIWSKFLGFFKSGRAEADLHRAIELAPAALPYIDLAAQIITGVKPDSIAAKTLGDIERKYPRLFDNSLQTDDEKKLYALGIAGDLLGHVNPGLSTSVLRLATQLAFTGKRADAAAAK